MIGRLAADPQPRGRRVLLRLVVTYGAERHERTVSGPARCKGSSQTHIGTLVYVVGHAAPKGVEHEMEADHVTERGPARARAS
jgi:hypothetical protein